MNMLKMRDVTCVLLLLSTFHLVHQTVAKSTLVLVSYPEETRRVNDKFFVLCKDNKGKSVKWTGPKGNTLGDTTSPRARISTIGTKLEFDRTRMEDAGVYVCSNEGESVLYRLTVEDHLRFENTNTSYVGTENTQIVLNCEAKGAAVTWSAEGVDLKDENKYQILADGLLIKNLQRNDSNTYICSAIQTSTGKIEDKNIKLRVKHQPYHYKDYESTEIVYGYLNGTVNLTCVVAADPPAMFEWTKNKDSFQKTGKIINAVPNKSVLQLYIDDRTFGEYKCLARNQYGKLGKTFSLERGAKPRPPAKIELKDRSADLLDLRIQPSEQAAGPGMEPIGFEVQYRPAESRAWASEGFNVTDGQGYPLLGLEHNTTYEVRAATRNIAGLSDYTSIHIFETLASTAHSIDATSFSFCALLLLYHFLSFT